MTPDPRGTGEQGDNAGDHGEGVECNFCGETMPGWQLPDHIAESCDATADLRTGDRAPDANPAVDGDATAEVADGD